MDEGIKYTSNQLLELGVSVVEPIKQDLNLGDYIAINNIICCPPSDKPVQIQFIQLKNLFDDVSETAIKLIEELKELKDLKKSQRAGSLKKWKLLGKKCKVKFMIIR